MSNRFGRGQKRRMREEIAALRDQNARLTEKLRIEREHAERSAGHLARLRAMVSRWDSEIVDILGEYSALRPEIKTVIDGDAERDHYVVLLREKLGPVETFSEMQRTIDCRIQALERLEHATHESPLDAKRIIAFRHVSSDGRTDVLRFNYMLGDAVLMETTRHNEDFLVEMIYRSLRKHNDVKYAELNRRKRA